MRGRDGTLRCRGKVSLAFLRSADIDSPHWHFFCHFSFERITGRKRKHSDDIARRERSWQREGNNLLLFTSLVEEALTRLSDSSSTPDQCRESSAEEEEQVLKLIGLERYEVFILLSEEMKRKKLELIFLPFNQLLPLPDLMLKHTYPFADKSPIKSRTSSKSFPDGKP
ncbi:unnamed protein product [Vicia faba]|uniref:Uncharacterized protein n=1 Tax=Vicia faba TaxID=3906 RepID=A0AAV0ZP56_VICFA|nr:unnamed protein product [Vicia faba]